MTPIADFIGPLAEGVIIFGIVPAVALIIGMMAVSRVVGWKTERSLASTPSDSDRQQPEAAA